jgi:hypothetical protein
LQNVAQRQEKIKGKKVRKPEFPRKSKASSEQACCFGVADMRKIYFHQAAKLIIIFVFTDTLRKNLPFFFNKPANCFFPSKNIKTYFFPVFLEMTTC